MSAYRFGSLPNWWFRVEGAEFLQGLRADDTGTGIAAMKCLLGLSVLINFYTRRIKVSLTELEALTGLSRPMVIRGLNRLESDGLVAAIRDKKLNTYELTIIPQDDKWAKVPRDKVRKTLKEISNRGIAPFTALKLYIALLSLRYKDNDSVKITHQHLRTYTGIQTTQLRQGLDVLYCTKLIHLLPREDRQANEYQLIGL